MQPASTRGSSPTPSLLSGSDVSPSDIDESSQAAQAPTARALIRQQISAASARDDDEALLQWIRANHEITGLSRDLDGYIRLTRFFRMRCLALQQYNHALHSVNADNVKMVSRINELEEYIRTIDAEIEALDVATSLYTYVHSCHRMESSHQVTAVCIVDARRGPHHPLRQARSYATYVDKSRNM